VDSFIYDSGLLFLFLAGLKLVIAGDSVGLSVMVVSVTGGGVFGWSLVFLHATENTSRNRQRAGINFIRSIGRVNGRFNF
jgi:hypothetical protein